MRVGLASTISNAKGIGRLKMTWHTITATTSAEIPAQAAVIYDIIADYRNGHPRILPPEHFTFLEVDGGGRGAGTRIRFGMKGFGRVTTYRGTVSEPLPGRVLRERLDEGLVTSYLIEPLGPDLTRTTIVTVYLRSGLRGLIERLLVPPFLRKVYDAELMLLAREAAAASTERNNAA